MKKYGSTKAKASVANVQNAQVIVLSWVVYVIVAKAN